MLESLKTRRAGLKLAAVTLAAAATFGGLTTGTWAQTPAATPPAATAPQPDGARPMPPEGGRGGHGGWHHGPRGDHEHGGMGMMGGPGGERGLNRMLDRVDATTEQRTKIKTIAAHTRDQLIPLREQMRADRKKGMELLLAPTVDRKAIEALRVDQARLGEQMSKLVSAGFADAADTLTPEQRAKLRASFEERREGGRRGEPRRG